MNRSALKKYAPRARLDFIEVVTLRARRLGLDPALPVEVVQTGDVLLINGQPFPASIVRQRTALAQRIRQQGFTIVMEALAYTWFNRFVAIRFMELKGYLSHGYRVLSHPQGQQPEILEHVQHLDLPGLNKAEAISLKTAGNQDEVLYREILLAQCHELHRYMPFLFEALDDATELLLPDNLLRTDSPIAQLVNEIEEGDWEQVEIIGWLYQFYISEKKDEVMGKVVRSEDIPAATQLFTPNWIVQYLVQNSLGRLWLMANPDSSLKERMPYYIEPAEQTLEVKAQLDALIKVRIDEDGGTLNPESLTVLDPACGSGHILVEAYSLLRAIYEERGYRLREIPRLILNNNLYGLDIDDRAAQLACFAVLMKAREDDRRLFDDADNPVSLNIFSVQDSAGLPDDYIAQTILNSAVQVETGEDYHSGQLFGGGRVKLKHSTGLAPEDLRDLIQVFAHGKTLGSLIQVPDLLKNKLGDLVELLESVCERGDEISRSYARQVLEQFARPAGILALHYDAVIANPPYMGNKGMVDVLKDLARTRYLSGRSDLYAMFIERGLFLLKETGFNSMVTMHTWMFLSSYEEMRKRVLETSTISVMAHFGARAFSEISGEVVQTVAFSLFKSRLSGYVPSFDRLVDFETEEKNSKLISGDMRIEGLCQDEFERIPGAPLAYWITEDHISPYEIGRTLGDVMRAAVGLNTGDNNRFLRYWFEVDYNGISYQCKTLEEASSSGRKWFPYNKGGKFRRWYGNQELVLNWEGDGQELKDLAVERNGGRHWSRYIQNLPCMLKPGITWSDITTDAFAARSTPPGFFFDVKGSSGFVEPGKEDYVLGLLCSKITNCYMKILNPSTTFQVGDISRIPYVETERSPEVSEIVKYLVSETRENWDERETSWGFKWHPVVTRIGDPAKSLKEVWGDYTKKKELSILSLIDGEEKLNRILIDIYGLGAHLDAGVSRDDLTIDVLGLGDFAGSIVSYAMGCLMGRYSLDAPGLIFAGRGGVGFDPAQYRMFQADGDGIVPVTEESWFEDDAAQRLRGFIQVMWGADTLVENMEWLADGLGRKAGESADDAIRRYLSTSFYKDHLQTYKKRPIYWLFSSGKEKAFECMVYLHRYNAGTLSRMRMEYVVPLQSRMQARIDKLTDDISSATSSTQQRALQKRKDKLTKQLEELRRFDETLRTYADQRITLDLDDGVKINYGKFGNLLAEVKVITGGKED
ncbi:BREX-1 system adenine-specific DNA-methyltransferase PglX [Pseudomonas sp. D(2018)]|uniref:BREX-1 system adenine-specific DNA-methyltransferase PglX n=1 Tax=Pseudomonas sp. D(2018) TaxID=2502238 RepID=UPI0010FA14CD|nr:BREX-1 system adenine-specific DNA-methyltransferase PglX [Pseudomonas sp. D(2018)]